MPTATMVIPISVCDIPSFSAITEAPSTTQSPPRIIAATPPTIKMIDFTMDHRLKREGNDFVYGLPELNREAIKKATRVANPGCFATAIQLALLPLAAAGILTNEVHINAITGSTGAGQKPTSTSHFSWRNDFFICRSNHIYILINYVIKASII